MTIIFLVLPLALLVVGAALWAYVWAARSGQFDDLETPALRVALDDDIVKRPTGKRSQTVRASVKRSAESPRQTPVH